MHAKCVHISAALLRTSPGIAALLWAGFHAVQLADGLYVQDLKAGVLDHFEYARLPKEVNRTASDVFQTHLANRHAPGPEARPGRQERSSSEPANLAQPLR